jgi:hypothetical protein
MKMLSLNAAQGILTKPFFRRMEQLKEMIEEKNM